MNMTCFLSQLLFQSVSQDMWMIYDNDMFSKSLIIYFHMEQKQLLFHFEYNNQTSTAFN